MNTSILRPAVAEGHLLDAERAPAFDLTRYRAEAAEAIAAVDPALRLTRSGFDGPPGPLSVRCVATALVFIDHGPARRTRRWRLSSYGLKHVAERWAQQRSRELEPYVANGDLIAAVLWRGIPIRRERRGSLNCRIALAVR